MANHTEAFGAANPRYTPEEKAIIIRNVKEFPDNLQEAFRKSSLELENRAVASVSSHYYSSIRKEHQNILSIGSSKGFSKGNAKIRPNKSDNQEVALESDLMHFHKVVIEILQLNAEEIRRLKIILDNI
jgi:hypothetical protein